MILIGQSEQSRHNSLTLVLPEILIQHYCFWPRHLYFCCLAFRIYGKCTNLITSFTELLSWVIDSEKIMSLYTCTFVVDIKDVVITQDKTANALIVENYFKAILNKSRTIVKHILHCVCLFYLDTTVFSIWDRNTIM